MPKELLRPTLAILNEDYPKIKNFTTERQIDDLMNYLITILGIKIQGRNEEEIKIEQGKLDLQMVLVYELIKTKFGLLTFEEVKEAMRMYVAKEFPEIKVFRLLDCIAIGEILSSFIEFRNESLRIYTEKKQNLLEMKKETTEKEKAEIRESFLKSIFDEINENGKAADAWLLFAELESSKKIIISNERKRELYAMELEKYRREEVEVIKESKGINAKFILEDLNRKCNAGELIPMVQNRCKSILVNEHLLFYTNSFEEFKNEIER